MAPDAPSRRFRLPAALAARRRWVTPEPLNVAAPLIGQPLAWPLRRALAMGIDLLLLALCSGLNGLWLAAGLVLVVLQLRSQRSAGTRWRLALGWAAVALVALLALTDVATRWDGAVAPGTEDPAAVEDDDGDNGRGGRQPTAVELAGTATAAALDAAVAASAAAGSASATPATVNADAVRIAALQAEVARLRKAAQPVGWRGQLRRQLRQLGLSFGWGIVYFSLLPAWWGGQTVGKKLLRLRVVELTGKPMTVMRNLKRYGGYAAGMATGGLGFAQVLWDANRQAIQDKTAHTVVIDLRQPPWPQPAQPPAPVPTPPVPAPPASEPPAPIRTG